MNSHFNYELDERQIKLILLDAEVTYNESAWANYEQSHYAQPKASTVNVLDYVPKVSLGISRSVILPVLFIVCIGSLSSLLFSFIDFKKKSDDIKEEPLVTTIQKKEIPSIKSDGVNKPLITKIQKNTTLTPTASIAVSNTMKITPQIRGIVNDDIVVNAKKIDEKVIKKSTSLQGEKNTPKKKKKNKRKIIAEELPTINTTNTISEPSNEPELKME